MGSIRAAAGFVVIAALAAHTALGQPAGDNAALRAQIEQRFDVLPLQDGIALKPKRNVAGVRLVELRGGTIAVDGTAVTGRELRERLAGDADAILRLSYLDAADQQALFNAGASANGAGVPAPPEPPFPPGPRGPRGRPDPEARRRVFERLRDRFGDRMNTTGDRVRIGGGVDVRADEVINGDVVAILGDATVDGGVTGNVVAVGGDVTLGPNAAVEGDVTVVGGQLHRDNMAVIAGAINDVSIAEAFFRNRPGPGRPFGEATSRSSRPLLVFFGNTARLGVVLVIAAIVLTLARGYVERVGERASAEPLKAGLVGLLIQALLIPGLILTIVLLAVTVIGIPFLFLIPFALLGFVVLWIVGFTAVIADVGRFLARRFGWSDQNPYTTVSLGVLALLAPAVIALLFGLGGSVFAALAAAVLFVGFCIEYLVWTVGLGAVALLRFQPLAPAGPTAPTTTAEPV